MVKIVEADEELTELFTISIVFASVELADLLCDVDKISMEWAKLTAVIEETIALLLMLATTAEVSGEISVVVKGQDRLIVSPLGPFDNVVDVATDIFLQEESTERDNCDVAGEVSIAVVVVLDVASD